MSMLMEFIHEFNTAGAGVQRSVQAAFRARGDHEAADFGAAFEALGHDEMGEPMPPAIARLIERDGLDVVPDLAELEREFLLDNVAAAQVRTCEGCGCTDDDACEDAGAGGPCFWVADYDGDLCSACARTMTAINESRRVEVYSPGEAQDFIERTRAARIGASA